MTKLKTEEYIVAFVDILGFTDFVKKYDSGLLPNVLEEIDAAFMTSNDFLTMNQSRNEHDMFNWKKYLKVKLFSDCLCAAIPTKINYNDWYYNFLFFNLYIATYQILLMEKGFFSRGGISMGSFFSNENMIFSGVLVTSVELEKKAIYPRVLISNELLKLISQHPEANSKVLSEMFAYTSEDDFFLNAFNIEKCVNLLTQESIEKINLQNPEHAKFLKKGMQKTKSFEVKQNQDSIRNIKKNIRRNMLNYKDNEKVLNKYIWLKYLLDWTINETQQNTMFKKYHIE
ncbi:MAG: hypothetical protein K8R74_05035 [Bacteroidales bacterium]|nr:hypothetical protein [Bacteroidales bacterium]